MDEWEAKYKALLKAIMLLSDVENAEVLIRKSIAMSKATKLEIERCFPTMLSSLEEPSKTLLGFPIETGDWMPANKAMIFGNFGAVITDFQTGECKVASKEDLEKALRNITEGS